MKNGFSPRLLLLLGACLVCQTGAVSARDNFSEVDIPPANALTIDGDLRDWDQNSLVETFFERSMYPNFSVKAGFRYDRKGLYIGAHFVDPTPMVNAGDPAKSQSGAVGDALEVQLISDPSAPHPYVAKNDRDANDRICRITMWYASAANQPVIQLDYGLDRHGSVTLTGKDSGVVFTKDADGKGYNLEAFIPWERLHAPNVKWKNGDLLSLTMRPIWGNSTGTAPMASFAEITRPPGDPAQNPSAWGQGKIAEQGHLPARPNGELAAGGDATSKPLQIHLTLDDPKAKVISLGLFDAEKGLIRSLPVVTRRESQMGADLALNWDGLDADGKPIPPGTYQLKQLTHQGIGQKFIASLHNSGNPPWKTDDGQGAWGGDWGSPVAAASDDKHVYLGWGFCEAGPAVVCVDKELDKDGMFKKLWGATPAMYDDIGITIVGLATEGDRLFVAQDGITYGGHKTKSKEAFAGITVYDARSGRPLKFPFGKSILPVAKWDIGRIEEQASKPLFERRQTNDFGPQQLQVNLTGIAAKGDTIYAALFLDNKIVALDWKTGKTIKEYPVESPSGVAVDATGDLIVAGGKGLLRIDPASGAAKTIAPGLSRPWGVSIDRQGNIAVADCGRDMQAKIFSPDGKLLRTVGKPGGRAWIGTYDPSGLLMPSGLTLDADGKLWVAENDDFPRRVSVWNPDGVLAGDFHGPCVPQTDRGVDPDNPSRINVEMVEYDLDYNTGKSRCVTTLWRPNYDGWGPVENFGRASRFVVRNFQGHQYGFLDHGYADRVGAIFVRKGDRYVPCASLGATPCVPIVKWGNEEGHYGIIPHPEQWLTPDQWKTVWNDKTNAFYHYNEFWHTWVDTNGDGIVQPGELTIERPPGGALLTFVGVDPDLSLIGLSGKNVLRLPVREITKEGIPVYAGREDAVPIVSKLSRPDGSVFVDEKRQRVYGLDAKGGDSRMRGEFAGVSAYDFSGKLLWLYRDTWLGFASDAPFFKPGYIIGVSKFLGEVELDNGVGLLVLPGYWGDYSMISTEGLWVHQFCQDNRLGGEAGPNTIFIENMTGLFFRNPKNGRVYLVGGDIDARVWEVTGLETIRTKTTDLAITDKDYQAATEVAKTARTTAPLEPIQLARTQKIEVDGKIAEWSAVRPVSIDAGAGRGAKVSLAYDDKNLYAAFKVEDRSPMANVATDLPLLFKGGDVCDIMLAADPNADPKRKTPVAGDTRLSFSVVNGKPVCVIYQAVSPVKEPKTFSSPTGTVSFDRVQMLETAEVAMQKTDTGYELEAQVPLADIGWKPGTPLRGDVGVLFGTEGGGRTILRSYYANKDTMVVEDVPSEARLAPANWTVMEVKP